MVYLVGQSSQGLTGGERWPTNFGKRLKGDWPSASAGERAGATGVVVWKSPRTLDDDAVVVLRLKDWQDLHGN